MNLLAILALWVGIACAIGTVWAVASLVAEHLRGES